MKDTIHTNLSEVAQETRKRLIFEAANRVCMEVESSAIQVAKHTNVCTNLV